MRAQLLGQAAALRCAAAALAADGDASVPAYRLGGRAPPHGEHAVHLALLMASAMTAALQEACAQRSGAVAHFGRPLSAPERAHLADAAAVSDALHAFLAPAQGALAGLRLGGGGAYLSISATVVEQLAALLGAMEDANRKRCAALGARAAGEPRGWRCTFLAHVAAEDGWVRPPAAFVGARALAGGAQHGGGGCHVDDA
jgi:hypothetical protein